MVEIVLLVTGIMIEQVYVMCTQWTDQDIGAVSELSLAMNLCFSAVL